MAEELIPIVQRAYDFAVDLYGAVNRVPRAQKPLLGRELVGLALRLLVTLVTANRRGDKVPALDEADVVVTDIAMPDTDGYTLARAVRRGARPPRSVALTAFSTDEDREKARRAGFDAHIAKPVLPRDLVREITDLVRGSRTR